LASESIAEHLAARLMISPQMLLHVSDAAAQIAGALLLAALALSIFRDNLNARRGI
jgi:hypothetical protein